MGVISSRPLSYGCQPCALELSPLWCTPILMQLNVSDCNVSDCADLEQALTRTTHGVHHFVLPLCTPALVGPRQELACITLGWSCQIQRVVPPAWVPFSMPQSALAARGCARIGQERQSLKVSIEMAALVVHHNKCIQPTQGVKFCDRVKASDFLHDLYLMPSARVS